MSDFIEALDRLGIRPVRAARATDYAPATPRPASVSGGGVGVPGAPPVPRKRFANAVPLTAGNVSSGNEDDGGVGGFFKNLATNALDVIDTPRAFVVSGVKELTDAIYDSPIGEAADWLTRTTAEERQENLERLGKGSWDEFVSQGWRNIGFREVMDNVTGDTQGKDRYAALGFLGDVVLDPTAWVTLGTSTAAGAAAKGTMKQAVTDGGGRVLAKELADSAVEAGLRNAPEVQRLVADAAIRGRGAITPRGLARAGVDDATREALGIPSLARTIGRDGVRLPGSAAVANVIEDAKGAAKGFLRTRPAAAQVRKWAPNPLGRRELMQTLASRSASVGEKFDAVLADATINRSLATARSWAADTDRRILRDPNLGKRLKKLTPNDGVALTNAIETGANDDLANALRGEFNRMRAEAVDMGVDIGDLGENYVPHIVSDEFRALARKDAEAAKILLSLESDVGVQKTRRFGVNPNQENVFLGETLQTGTIEEMNGIAQKKLGVNIFVDDVRDTLPRYIDQLSKAIAREQQIKLLTEKGVVRSLAEKKVMKTVPNTPEEVADLQAARDALKRARDNERVALRDGSTYRRKELAEVRSAVRARVKELNARVADLDRKIKDAERGLTGAQMKLARNQKVLAEARAALDNWKTVAKTERGQARRKAQAEIKRLEARIAEVQKAIEVNQSAIKRIMSDRNISLPERTLMTQTPAAGVKAWQAQRETIRAELDEHLAKLDEIRTLKLGEGTSRAERSVARATERVQAAQLQNKGLSKEVNLAARALDGAVAERQLVGDEVTQAKIVLDDLMDKASGLEKAGVDELRDRVNLVSEILVRENDPLVQRIAQFEAMALAADAAAAAARGEQASLAQVIDIMSSKKFAEETIRYVEKGMVEIGDGMQIPEWLNDALKIEPVRLNWVESQKFIRQFYNLWKGYAILRPGFHVRNAYSAMFNVYLEAGAGALPNIRRAYAFDDLVMKHPADYMERAAARWEAKEAAMLNEAHMAMRATGAGQAAGEFTSSEFHKGKFNPVSEDFRLLKRNRKIGEWVERKIRTAHAYDVLKRGGNIDQAVDVVNKWHFNYTDISSFDRAARVAMPFWTFFSRNLALQGQTWFRSAARLNRVYQNAERNLSYGQEEDTLVPDWYGDAGAIRLPGMDADGTTRYLFPDLPAAQAPAQFYKFMTPWTGQFLGDVGPIKTFPEVIAGKQFFSGIPLEREAVEAGSGATALDRLGILEATGMGGNGMVDERLQYAINSLVPGAGMVDRLAGLGGEANAERQGYARLAALTGVGVRENNERTRQGEQYRRMLEEQARARFAQQVAGG